MISRRAIRHLIEVGLIRIEPKATHIGPNSIDLHLGDSLKMYAPAEYGPSAAPAGLRMEWERPSVFHNRLKVVDPVTRATFYALDPKNPPPLIDVPKLEDGRWLLTPGQFYIGCTKERTFCKGVVPHLDGRSTCGRLSIEAHKTAGVGDNGFEGCWTLEIEVTEPVLVAPGDRLFQIYFTPCWGEGLALLISAASEWVPGTTPKFDAKSMGVKYGPDDGALLELEDLYGGSGHHYQNSTGPQGPSPLDGD